MPFKFECEECGKHFASNYSIKRHVKSQHGDGDSDNNSVTKYSESESSNSSTITSSSSSPTDKESESNVSSSEISDSSEEEDVDNSVFDAIIKSSYMSLESERNTFIKLLTTDHMGKHAAIAFVNKLLYPKYLNAFKGLIIQMLLSCEKFEAHPIIRTIMNKANKLESDTMDRDEAICAAVNYRKHLIARLFPSLNILSRNMTKDEDELSTNTNEDTEEDEDELSTNTTEEDYTNNSNIRTSSPMEDE